ncbi:uncharacterized protein LOC136067671 [Quercus suber]|uniref:uncharacterized protein LOC136067671 n=1 Tax=Quercus suber TaxID=58331 RepID=UPI0032DEF4E8
MKNPNGRNFDKDRKQSSSSQFKSQDKGMKDTKDGGQCTVLAGPKIVEEVDEEEELVESKFEKIDDHYDIHSTYKKLCKLSKKHEKLYRLATKKLSDVELDREELSSKFDEVNQTTRALRFENNFLAEKTKKLEAKLFQVRSQLERTSSAKLDEMLSNQKTASDRTSIGSTPSTSAPSSSTGDVSPGDIMVQLQHMDTRLDTLSAKLYQVNVCVGRIVRRQATMGGFAPKATPSPPTPAALDSDDDKDDDDDDDDGDARSTDEMST